MIFSLIQSTIALPPLSSIEILGHTQTSKIDNFLNKKNILHQVMLNGQIVDFNNSEAQIHFNIKKKYLKIFSPILINLNDINKNIWNIEWLFE